ncbi:hypothetical protein JD844_014803 [Phrynosoma platyrhinos]|uniref:Arpin n=1 Tax=Phrynosoma platyrhinos TaxID=52577 RepID=A0ABQ7SS38_PHRPL|nr:hypothetical protein JD844_014803 [Phrynosoma platyrhinos]
MFLLSDIMDMDKVQPLEEQAFRLLDAALGQSSESITKISARRYKEDQDQEIIPDQQGSARQLEKSGCKIWQVGNKGREQSQKERRGLVPCPAGRIGAWSVVQSKEKDTLPLAVWKEEQASGRQEGREPELLDVSRHLVWDASGRKERYFVLYVKPRAIHRCRFDPKGNEVEPNFSETRKVSTGFLLASYLSLAKLEAGALTKCNFSGDRQTGASWTESILACKDRGEPSKMPREDGDGANEDEWVGSGMSCAIKWRENRSDEGSPFRAPIPLGTTMPLSLEASGLLYGCHSWAPLLDPVVQEPQTYCACLWALRNSHFKNGGVSWLCLTVAPLTKKQACGVAACSRDREVPWQPQSGQLERQGGLRGGGGEEASAFMPGP